jgi:hypothetical protein
MNRSRIIPVNKGKIFLAEAQRFQNDRSIRESFFLAKAPDTKKAGK